MKIARAHACALALAGGALFLGSAAADESPAATDAARTPIRFAAPKRIEAGGALLGAGRLYPSPVLHDVDGDGRRDIVVGDLMGRVTVALRTDDGFAAEKPLQDRDGKPLKFHNW